MIGIQLTIKSFLDSQINFQEENNPFLGELRWSTQNLFIGTWVKDAIFLLVCFLIVV